MTDQGKKYLSDILLSIDLIESFTINVSSFEKYSEDLKTQSAVERQLGIIGEAINKFEKLFPEKQLDHSRKIVGLRNRIIHSYDTIDSSIIWAIIKKHLQPLKKEVQLLMK
jgi:uncharacterized protein with HEPN domain